MTEPENAEQEDAVTEKRNSADFGMPPESDEETEPEPFPASTWRTSAMRPPSTGSEPGPPATWPAANTWN